MNSPDFWRLPKGLCPDQRGYPATFRQCTNPIGGEYLEIPSIAVIHSHRYRHGQKGWRGRLITFDLIEKRRVSLLISFSVEVGENVLSTNWERAMHYKLIAIFAAVTSFNVSAESTDIAICRDPSGKAFRHFSGPQDKATAGWSDEKIGGGVVTLVQGTDGTFDMLYVDVRKRPISMAQDGAKIIKLRSGPSELSLLAHYSGSTSEIYSFFREKDGKNRYTVMTSRIGPETFAPKSSIMVGDCEPIRFDLIRGQ